VAAKKQGKINDFGSNIYAVLCGSDIYAVICKQAFHQSPPSDANSEMRSEGWLAGSIAVESSAKQYKERYNGQIVL
jgi:hypothetical protein